MFQVSGVGEGGEGVYWSGDGEGAGTWDVQRIGGNWVGLVRFALLEGLAKSAVRWCEGLEGGLGWLEECNRRCMGAEVEVAVHGMMNVGWILRFRSAERSGVGFLLNILDGCKAICFEIECYKGFNVQANNSSRLIQVIVVGLLAPTRSSLPPSSRDLAIA